MQCPPRLGEDSGSFGSRVPSGCDPPSVVVGYRAGPLEEQQTLITAEPPLQPYSFLLDHIENRTQGLARARQVYCR